MTNRLIVSFISYMLEVNFVTEQSYVMLYKQKKYRTVMNPTVKYSAFIASLILVMPYVAFADQGTQSQTMQVQLASVTCTDNYDTAYLNDVVNAINNPTITSTITTTDIPKLNADFAELQADATTNNAAQFKTDSQKFTSDQRTASLDAVTAIKAAHSTTVNSTLKSETSQLQSAEKSCLFAAKQQKAQVKIQTYTKAITNAQNLSNDLTKHGANTGALNQTIVNTNSQIQAFQTAVNNAQNSTQLQVALNSFCLYNGCKTVNNFHFAANTAIQADQAKLNLLSGKNSTTSFQALVAQAQSDITNAQNALTQVGANQYQGTQSNTVWNNIKAAADVIHQLQQIVNHKHK
jgi:hypothetical protein